MRNKLSIDPLTVVPAPDERLFARAGELDGAGGGAPHRSERLRPHSRMLALVTGFAALVAGVLLLTRLGASPMVDEAILLRGLSPGQAAELVRPLLDRRTNTVVYSPDHAPQVLTVRGTPDQLKNVHSVLDRYESAGSSCAAG